MIKKTNNYTTVKQTAKAKELFNTKKYKEYWEFHQKITEDLPVIIWIINDNGSSTYLNDSWYNYTDQTPESALGDYWTEAIHPKDRKQVKQILSKAIKNQRSFEMEYRLKKKSGSYRWHLGSGNPVFNDDGIFEGMIGTMTDVHKQKQTDEKLQKRVTLLKTQNAKLNQMRILRENLLHIIGHDLRGPVGNIKLGLELFHSIQDEKGKVEIIDGLQKVVIKQQKVVDGLTELISVQNPKDVQFTPVNLEEIMLDILNHYQFHLGKDDKISYDFKEVPVIRYVHSFAYSILKNMVSNALKYRSDEKPLKVKVESKKADGFVAISVKDNGIGIDLEKHEKDLFHVFRRLTDKADGSGIGLYIVKNLLEGNGGRIEVKSEPETGSTFICYLKEYI